MKDVILFNPINIVHDRYVGAFGAHLPEWSMRCIYNMRFPWFSDKRDDGEKVFHFTRGLFPRVPKGALDNVKAVIFFTSQVRVPPCSIVQEAALRSIPVIAVEEVHQMLLEQGLVNNYFLPVDHLFVTSEYERERFLEIGVGEDVVQATGHLLHVRKSGVSASGGSMRLKEELGLDPKKSVATLSLEFLKPGGEIPEIRAKLLALSSKGLPDRYQLLIKPHPAEQDRSLYDFVKRYAPDAKIAPSRTPIDTILGLTDVLLNRGNSQVVIDSLEKGVPVIAMPLGIKTMFHGLSDALIANDIEGMARAIDLVEKSGMSIYDDIFRKYLSIKPEKAMDLATLRIKEIIRKNEVREQDMRLVELAAFWAYMGYSSQAVSLLGKVRSNNRYEDLKEGISKLISGKAIWDDLMSLRKVYSGSYKEWIIQSLWIKIAYLKDIKLTQNDCQWLHNFPPRMNRFFFLPYARLLYWRYIRSGMVNEAMRLADQLRGEYGSIPQLRGSIGPKPARHIANLYYWRGRLQYRAELLLKKIAQSSFRRSKVGKTNCKRRQRNKRAVLTYLSILLRVSPAHRWPMLYRILEIKPSSATIMITNRCNSRCIMCRQWREPAQEELTASEWKEVIKDLKENKIRSIHFSGGEPLLRKDLKEIVSYVCREGFVTGLTTNGLLLTDDILKSLIEVGLRSVAVSMDAVGPAYEDIRGLQNSFGSLKKSISILGRARKEHGIDAYINFTLMKTNMNELSRVKEIADKNSLPIAICLLDKTSSIFSLEANRRDFWISEAEDFRKLDKVLSFLKDEKIKNPGSLITSFPAIDFIKDYFKEPRQGRIPCASSQDRVILDPYGNLLGGCMAMGTFGNVRKTPLGELRSEEIYKTAKRNMFYKRCAGCSCGYLFNIRHVPSLIIKDGLERVKRY